MVTKKALRLFDKLNESMGLQTKKLEVIANALDGKSHVLELGVGSGSVGEFLLSSDSERIYEGIDIDENCIEYSRERLKKYGERVKLERMSSTNLSYSDSSFDGVTSVGSLCGMEDLDGVFSESYRVLKKGGIFLCTTVDFDKTNVIVSEKMQEAIIRGNIRLSESDLEIMKEYGKGAMYQHSDEQVQLYLKESGFEKWKSKEFSQNVCTLYIATK